MNGRYGIVLLEDTEVIFRVYETTDHEWRLFHYHSSLLPESQPLQTDNVLEIIGDFLATEYAQYIEEWKICSRNYPKTMIQELSHTLNIAIEPISLHREQELLCKGMFTELW